MTLLVFLGILVSLLILRLVPGTLLRLALALPRHRPIARMRWVHDRKISIALPLTSATALLDTVMAGSSSAGAVSSWCLFPPHCWCWPSWSPPHSGPGTPLH
jgi:hypothetical protein